jgi:hypothetical protein
MKYWKLFFVFIVFIFAACGSGKDKIPDSVLPIDKMVQVQVGIHMLEAERGERTIDQSLAGTDTMSFQPVFQKENIKKSQYDSSLIFYSSHPQLLDEVYDKVINELNKMQAEEKKKK